MMRIVFFVIVLFAPAFLGWWIFFPLALLYFILVRNPFELVLAGAMLDKFFYFGEGFIVSNMLLITSLVLSFGSIFMDRSFILKKYF